VITRSLTQKNYASAFNSHDFNKRVKHIFQHQCRTAVICDCSAGLYLVMKNSHQGVDGSYMEWELEMFSKLALQTTEHPLPFHFVAPIVLSFVNWDGFVRAPDLLRTACNVVQHGLSILVHSLMAAEPNWCSCWSLSRKAPKDVMRKKTSCNWGYSAERMTHA